MDYVDVMDAVSAAYWQALMDNDKDARDAARRAAEWLGVDRTLADIITDELKRRQMALAQESAAA